MSLPVVEAVSLASREDVGEEEAASAVEVHDMAHSASHSSLEAEPGSACMLWACALRGRTGVGEWLEPTGIDLAYTAGGAGAAEGGKASAQGVLGSCERSRCIWLSRRRSESEEYRLRVNAAASRGLMSIVLLRAAAAVRPQTPSEA